LESLRLCGFTVATAKDMRGISRWGIGASTYFSNIKVLLRPTGEVLLPFVTFKVDGLVEKEVGYHVLKSCPK
jgi:hypothetical protein